jgi:hypothetical protein
VGLGVGAGVTLGVGGGDSLGDGEGEPWTPPAAPPVPRPDTATRIAVRSNKVGSAADPAGDGVALDEGVGSFAGNGVAAVMANVMARAL